VVFSLVPQYIKSSFTDPTVAAGLKAALADPTVLADPKNKGILEIFQAQQSGTGNVGDALNGDTQFLTTADPRLAAPFLHGFSQAMVTGFWVSLIVLTVAFILAWFMKATPLRKLSALQEVAAEDAAILAQSAAAAGAPGKSR